MRPRKRFGQHFLRNRGVIDKIIHALDPQPGDHVVEIGPGEGVLTEPLANAVATLDLIEIDRDLGGDLQQRYHTRPGIRVHVADALKFDFKSIGGEQKLRIVGNLPYNISTPLFFHLLAHLAMIRDIHVMIQKEVADRLCAMPRSKQYGRLSVMAQIYCQIQTLFTVSPGSFFPPPKVDSAVIRILPRQVPQPCQPQNLKKLLTHAFSSRRKTLKNTLKYFFSEQAMIKTGLDLTLRPDQIPVDEYARLSLLMEPSESDH